MNDLAAQRLKILNRIRGLLWKYEQHRKHPANLWTDEDATELQGLLDFVETLVPPDEFEKGASPRDFDLVEFDEQDWKNLKERCPAFSRRIIRRKLTLISKR